MTNGNHYIFQFDDVRVEPSNFKIWKGGAELAVEPKTFQVLLFLLENRERLIEKNELLDAVWKDTFVTENAMTREIGKLRRALGDDPKTAKYIQTVHTQGYRFIAETQEIKTNNDLADPVFDTSVPGRKLAGTSFLSVKRPGVFGLIFGIMLIGAIGLGYNFYAGKIAFLGAAVNKSIVVLPIKPINSANRDDIYEIGIAESLIRKLGSMKGFVVRPLSAVRRYAGIDQDSLAAGREQQADYVLASNYQLANGKIRVTFQLINIRNGQNEETYESAKDLTDIFAMQDSIADDVGNMLSARFATTSGSPVAKRGTTNEGAYRLYQQAMYLYDKRTPADAQNAVGLLEQAIQFDPNYARAWAGKAHVHRALGNFGRDTHEEYKKSIDAVNRALALDENLADAHSALCENKFFYEWDLEGAEVECKRAIELDPNSSLSHQIYSRNLMVLGHFDESIAEIKTAIDIEPTSLFSQRNFGISFYYARRYTDAVAQFKRVTEMEPNFEATYPWLINTLKLQGNDSEAFDWFMKWLKVRETDDETAQIFKTAYQKSGWQGLESERIKRFDESKIRTYFMEACMAALAGNQDKALEYLEDSYQRHEWGMAFIRFEPTLDVLRGDPRFDEIVGRVNAK